MARCILRLVRAARARFVAAYALPCTATTFRRAAAACFLPTVIQTIYSSILPMPVSLVSRDQWYCYALRLSSSRRASCARAPILDLRTTDSCTCHRLPTTVYYCRRSLPPTLHHRSLLLSPRLISDTVHTTHHVLLPLALSLLVFRRSI